MRVVTHGATDQSVELYIVDADGLPATGLAYNSSGIDLWYRRNGAAVTSITEATQTANGAHSDGGFVGLGNGVYRLDPPDAAFASGVSHVTFGGTITSYTVYPVTVQLSAFDLQTATQAVNVTQFGGSNGTFSSGRPEVNTSHWGGTAVASASVRSNVIEFGGSFIVSSGGIPAVNVVQISSDTTAADNAESFFDGTGYAGTGNIIPTVTTVNGLGAGVITAASIAADAITDAKVASDVTIASVTGAVGSVTAGVTLANDAITAAKFDESTAFPLTSADTSTTRVARTGADSDTLETLSDQIDGISVGANPNVILTAEIATLSSQTSFTLATGADFNDAYNGQAIVLYDDSNNDYPSVRTVSDYVGSTKTVTLSSAPDFTVGTDDSVAIFATAPGSTGASVADIWGADPTDYAAGTMGGDVMKNTDTIVLSEESAEDLADIIGTELQGLMGTTQPRINQPPDPGFTTQVSRRNDGTYKCTKPIRITSGAITQVFAFIDMSPLFGTTNLVETVGTPTVSGGSVTASAEGPRDTYAVVELDGTATAGEERTVTVPVTMSSGTQVDVVFDLEVFE